MPNTVDNRFKYTFWFCVGCTVTGLAYIFLITFVEIPEKNIRHADTASGFFLGTLITACLFYLTGGNPSALQKKGEPGTITTDLSVTATQTTTENTEKDVE